jgi:hypothetical protein
MVQLIYLYISQGQFERSNDFSLSIIYFETSTIYLETRTTYVNVYYKSKCMVLCVVCRIVSVVGHTCYVHLHKSQDANQHGLMLNTSLKTT